MRMRRAQGLIGAGVLLLLLGAAAGYGRGWLGPEDRIEDVAYWRMFSEFSEPSGYFQSDNLVSNELTFPALMPEIAKRTSRRSAYVGVGPEQNFSYLAALRPRIAFIVDIRRQNAILHLLYKALFELAPTRADFLSRLFSRAPSSRLDPDLPVDRLVHAFAAEPPNAVAFHENLREVRSLLTSLHGFALGDDDMAALRFVYSAFFEEGPAVQYSFGSWRRGRPFPSFAELMTATDDRGVAASFLSTEESYGAIRDLQRRNLIVPVVGDFAGERGLRAVASYLEGRGLTLSVLYTSNVEQYLFRSEDWRAFYANLARFPVESDSVLVRSVFTRFYFDPAQGGFSSYTAGGPSPLRRGTLHLDPIQSLTASFGRGEVESYESILARSK